MTEKIVIVGGGSSGWMSAAFLIKNFPNKLIYVIESPDVPIVGVGESTLADITNFRDYLGIDEIDFMRSTNASYKMSIKFTDFYEKNGGSFHYPFRYPELSETENGLLDWMEIKAFYPETPVEDFARCYFPQSTLYENNKFSKNKYGEFSSFNPKSEVAYHFDATKFGAWLKTNYCIPKGVLYISATVESAIIDDDGIKTLYLSTGEHINADLFIDCTGFKSLLLGEYLKEPFESYSNYLPNNRAWAAQIPYVDKEKELEPFTNSTAIENGWCWNIPLWSRLGTGYVYSDKFVSPEEAKKEFKQYLASTKMVVPRTQEQIDALEFKDITMRVGIHERTWVKNVVAIGLSAGFIEPLESTGLFTVQWFLYKLVKVLLKENVNQFDKDVYNAATRSIYNNFVEFVGLHYSLSNRTDTEYWRYINKKTFSQELISLTPTTTIGYFDFQNKKMFPSLPIESKGITYISVGMNSPFYDKVDQMFDSFGEPNKKRIDKLKSTFDRKKEKWNLAAKNSPSLYRYLLDNVHTD